MQPLIFLGLICLGASESTEVASSIPDCPGGAGFLFYMTMLLTHVTCFMAGKHGLWELLSTPPEGLGSSFAGVFGAGFAPVFHYDEARGHTVTLDIGAASNLTGSIAITEFERRQLIPRGFCADRWWDPGNFTGISGKPVTTNDGIQIPLALGQGLPWLNYRAHALRALPDHPEIARLPPLFSLQAMKSLLWRLFTDEDAVYVSDPAEDEKSRIYKRIPLIFTGHHYEMRIDQFEEKEPVHRYRIDVIQLKENGENKQEGGELAMTPSSNVRFANENEKGSKNEKDDEEGASSGDEEAERQGGKFRNIFREASMSVLRRDRKIFSEKDLDVLRKRAKELAHERPSGPPPRVREAEASAWGLMELGGRGEITRDFRRLGGVAPDAFCATNGWDWLNKTHQREIRKAHRTHQPQILFVHPDVHLWLSLVEKGLEKSGRSWQHSPSLSEITFLEEISAAQLGDERDLMFSDSPRSEWWLLPSWDRIQRTPGSSQLLVTKNLTDMCAYGLAHPGGPHTGSGDRPIGKKPMRRQLQLQGTVPLDPKTLRVCLGHRGEAHFRITGQYFSDGKWRSLSDFCKRLPNLFSANLAKDFQAHLSMANERKRSQPLTLAAKKIEEECKKCLAKRMGRRYTGPHQRDKKCCLSDDPRWNREAPSTTTPSSSSTSSSSSAGSTSMTSTSSSSSSSAAREPDAGDQHLPRVRQQGKFTTRVHSEKYAVIFVLSHEGPNMRLYLGQTSPYHNERVHAHGSSGCEETVDPSVREDPDRRVGQGGRHPGSQERLGHGCGSRRRPLRR